MCPTAQKGAPRFLLTVRSFWRARKASVCGGWAIGEPIVVGIIGLNVGTSMSAPRFLGPAVFRTFTLLTSLFQYATKNCAAFIIAAHLGS
jgi:hypothetical protein